MLSMSTEKGVIMEPCPTIALKESQFYNCIMQPSPCDIPLPELLEPEHKENSTEPRECHWRMYPTHTHIQTNTHTYIQTHTHTQAFNDALWLENAKCSIDAS